MLRFLARLSYGVNPDIMETLPRPTQRGAMQLRKSSILHLISDDGNLLRVSASILVETCDRKEEILEGVQGIVFGGHPGELCVGLRYPENVGSQG